MGSDVGATDQRLIEKDIKSPTAEKKLPVDSPKMSAFVTRKTVPPKKLDKIQPAIAETQTTLKPSK